MNENVKISPDIVKNRKKYDLDFPKSTSVDIIKNHFYIAGRDASIYHINGMLNTDAMVKILTLFSGIDKRELDECESITEFAKRFVPYTDYKPEKDYNLTVDAVLSAQCVLIIDGYCEALILDTKIYPTRTISEPEKNKTMRGPRDGFTESIITNTSLIRRRIKTTSLAFEMFEIGTETKTKIIMGYVSGKADERFVTQLRKKLSKITMPSLTLTQEALVQELFKTKGFKTLNPFPKVRFIERPDTASSMLLEGKVMLLCDTSPTAIFLPISVYDFIEETDDYYFPPLTATYMRILRIGIIFLSVILSPLWLLLTKEVITLPETMGFLTKTPESTVPFWIQLLLIELTVDALKIASLNTPNAISNSLGVVSGLLLGEFAIQVGWFVPQTILYSSICAIANYIPTNYELGYSIKFWRMSLIVFVELWKVWGFVINIVLFFILLSMNKTADGKSYLFPFSPFSKQGVKKFFVRTKSGKEKT